MPETSQPSAPSSSPHSSVQSPPPPTIDEKIAAASKIQSFYRALSAIKSIHSQYENLQRNFSFPSILDFVDGDALVSVEVSDHTKSAGEAASDEIDNPSTRKLAYTTTNAPLHFHTESLSRLLVALDGVESRGHKTIREKRREVVRQIEGDAAVLEMRVRRVWDEQSHKNAGVEMLEQEKPVEAENENTDAELLSPLLTASECEMNQVEMMLDVDSDEGPLPDVEVGDVATVSEIEADGPVLLNPGLNDAADSDSALALQSDADPCHDGSDVSFESATRDAPPNDGQVEESSAELRNSIAEDFTVSDEMDSVVEDDEQGTMDPVEDFVLV